MLYKRYAFWIQPCKDPIPWHKVFTLDFRAESYSEIREKAQVIAQNLANSLHFYHVKFTMITEMGILPEENLVQCPYYFGGPDYSKPDTGWDN